MTLPASGTITLEQIAEEFRLPVTQSATGSPTTGTFSQIRNGNIDTDNPVKIRLTTVPTTTYTYSIPGITDFSCVYYAFCTNNYTFAKFGFKVRYRIYQNGSYGSYATALTTIISKSRNPTDFGPRTGTLTLYSGAKLTNDSQIQIEVSPASDVSDGSGEYWSISGQDGGQQGPFGGGSLGLNTINYTRIYYPNARNGNLNLSDYYRGGSYVWDTGTNTDIPTSGAISFSNFLGTTRR
jgi:hypothetical protein